MLSAHNLWNELKVMCLLIACAAMIGILSGVADGDQSMTQPRLERPAATAH